MLEGDGVRTLLRRLASVAAVLGRAVETAGELPDRSRRRRWLGIELVIVADGVLLLVTLAAGYGELDAANSHSGREFPNLTLLFLAATLTGPLALRDRRPRLAWVFSTMAMLWTVGVARDLLGAPFTTAGVVVWLYCLYTLAARSDRRVTAIVWSGALLLVTLVGYGAGPLPGLHDVPDHPGWIAYRLVWLPVFALALAALWAVFRRFERPHLPASPHPHPAQASARDQTSPILTPGTSDRPT